MLGLALGVGAACAGVAGCTMDEIDHGRTPCNTNTCSGCCTSNGRCLSGDQPFACGAHADACRRCTDELVCREGACVSLDEPDAGTVPDAGLPACGPHNCSGCCEDGECRRFDVQDIARCGSGGEACGACEATDAVCDLGACVVPSCALKVTHPTHGRPDELDFDRAPVGATARIEVTLHNLGEGTCTIQPPRWLEGTDLNAFGFGGQPVHELRLGPNDSARLEVSFTPYAPLLWDDAGNAFTFTANDGAPTQCASGERGCRRKIVRGAGVASELPPEVLVSPEVLDLGEVEVGCHTPWRTVMVVNAAAWPVQVQVSAPPDGFELQPIAQPIQLPPRGSVPLRVRALATAAGTLTGALHLTDSLSGSHTVSLVAEAIETPERTLRATVPGRSDMDVLVVMHDGTAMTPVQDAVGSAANVFLQRAATAGGAWRLGVITSDASQASGGLLQGSPKFLGPGTTASALSAHLRPGQSGGIDQSLETLRLAAFPPRRTDPLRNGTFFRSGQRTGVLFVSNSEERSGGGLVDYVGAVREVVGGGTFFDGPRVVGMLTGGGCSTGTRWREALSLFGGTCLTLHPASPADALAEAADLLFSPVREVFLRTPVDPQAPVEVRVDGAPIPMIGAWTLDRAKGVVRFEPAWLPPPGSEVEVRYRAACQP